MNRHLKVSLGLAALSLTTIGLLTSCNSSTDLEGKIDENHSLLQQALTEAIKKAENELKVATTDLQAAIDASKDSQKTQLDKAINDLTESIKTAKTYADAADADTKAALEKQIEDAKAVAIQAAATNLQSVKDDLTGLINGYASVTDSEIKQVKADLEDAIAIAQTIAAYEDGVLKEELLGIIDSLQKEVEDACIAVIEERSQAIEGLVQEGYQAVSNELQESIESLNQSITIASILASENDEILRNELVVAIQLAKNECTLALEEGLVILSNQLSEQIEAGDLATVAALRAEMEVLEENIEAAKKLAEDNAMGIDKLNDAIEDLKAGMTEDVKKAIELATADLDAKIEAGDLKSAENLEAALAEVEGLIAASEKLASDKNIALREEIMGALDVFSGEVAEGLVALSTELRAEFEQKLAENSEESAAIAGVLATAITEAKEYCLASDEALKTSILSEIYGVLYELSDNLTEALANVQAQLDDKANASDVETLMGLIAAAESAAEKSDAAVKEELNAAIQSAVDSLENKIETLRAELMEAIANADQSVGNKADELFALIEATQSAYAEADLAVKNELETLINNTKNDILDSVTELLAKDKAELEAMIQAGDKAQAENLSNVKLHFEAQLADVKVLYDALKKQDDQFHEKIDALYNEIRASIVAVYDASMKLEDWGYATDDLVAQDGGLAKLELIFQSYEAKQNTYVDNDFALVKDLYAEYWVRMIRATSTTEIENLLADFDSKASAVRTWQDRVYDSLMAVGKDVSEVEYDADGELLLAASLMLNAARESGLDESYLTAYPVGDTTINLQELYDEYYAAYIALGQLSDGADIKSQMDALVGPMLWNDVELYNKVEQVLDIYAGWAKIEGNNASNIEGFEESLARVQEMYDRYWKLDKAKTYADEINEKLNKVMADVEASGATWANDFAVNSLLTEAQGWIATFFSGDYASEIGTSANYELLNVAGLEKLEETFNAKVDEFKSEAEAFKNAVLGIGEEVTLLSWDEINAALSQYGDFVLSRDLNDFTYLFDEGETPAKYYELLVRRYGEYRTLKTSAYNEYVELFADVDTFTVSIYDGAKIDAMLNWYETYGVKDENGAFVFDNGDYVGYVLGTSLTVFEADYQKVVGFKAEYDVLRLAKRSEAALLYAAIEEISYNVTYGQRDAVAHVRELYDGYLAGTNLPEGFSAEQFAIRPELHVDGMFAEYEIANVEQLILSEEIIADLVTQVNVTKAFIAGLKDYRGYSDFLSLDDRNSYDTYVRILEASLEKFYIANHYSYEDAFTAEEFEKVATARLAVQKYDATADLYQYARDFIERAMEVKLGDADKEVLQRAIVSSLSVGIESIDVATDLAGVEAASALAYDKFAAITSATEVYDQYLAAFTFDTELVGEERAKVALKMSLSFETTLNRIVESTNKEDVEQNVKFVADELESIYPMPELQ